MDFSSTELLEEWDWESGRPAGRAVPRGESYKRGVPHEGVHLWIVRHHGGVPELLFQWRASHKSMYPDCLDITVGGHVPFGLQEGRIQKEAMEEIGIQVSDADMTDLGYMRYEEITPDYIHREFQHVYIMKDERRLDSYCFNDGEVTGICAVPVPYIRSLYDRDAELDVEFFTGTTLETRRISRHDFHPLLFSGLMKTYMTVVLSAAEQLVNGTPVSSRMPGIS